MRMNSAISKILEMRGDKSLSIYGNTLNRYGIVFNENDGTHTGYYLSVPIYNTYRNKLAVQKFQKIGNTYCLNGSNCDVEIHDSVTFNCKDSSCSIIFENDIIKQIKASIANNLENIMPTTNGISLMIACKNDECLTFNIETNIPFLSTRENDKMFAYMAEQFKPVVVVSSIGTINCSGNIIAPALISSSKINDKAREIKIKPCSINGKYVLFEINYYESKLFEDTTVESLNPTSNNAYGGIAYIGKTKQFGEQWLYVRIDASKISELYGKKIHNAILRLPKLTEDNVTLAAYPVSTRFCSFGSNWDNKVSSLDKILNVDIKNNCYEINVTDIMVDPKTKYMVQTNGLIIKTKRNTNKFTVIPTGDSFFAPLSIEINYK